MHPGYFEGSPRCTPDGKWVYFVDSPTSRLMRVSVDGGAAEPIPGSNFPNQWGLQGISFITEDGKSLGFVVEVIDPHTNDAQTKLAIVNLDAGSNGPARLLQLDPRLASTKGFGTNVHALPNFAGVAYPISENGVTNLWVQSLDGSPGHQVTHFPSEETSDFHWSPDGKTLAIIREQDVADVVLIREANP